MRRLLALLLLLGSCSKEPDTGAVVDSIRVEDLKKHQTYLASRDLEGRKAGSPGGAKAAVYLEGECKRLGLKPVGKDGGYLYPFGNEGMKDVIGMWPGTDPAARDRSG